jgi:group I intron endonuclease
MESAYTLYIATNVVNGKQYVGMSKEFQKRLISHKCAKSKSAFHVAIKKYGFDKFVFSHIADAFDLQAACDLERMLIQQHNTLSPNGYNLTVGGQIGPVGLKHSTETKKKIGDANRNRSSKLKDKFASAQKGKIRSQEFKDNLSKQFTGRKHTPEAIEKIKASWEKRKQAKLIASTILNNLSNKEIPNGV